MTDSQLTQLEQLARAATPQFLDERLPMRFWGKCTPEPNTGCWLWHGSVNKAGYGNVWDGRAVRLSHRVSYLALVGDVPPGMELDHRCNTPSCCNPEHLRPMSHRENTLRGRGRSAVFARATHCPAGHALTGDNLILFRGRIRRCRACSQAWDRARSPDRIARLRRLGQCSSCSESAAPGRTKCAHHLEVARMREAAKRSAR